jgi:uncharacterized protein (TIGR03083 family)
VCGLRRRRDAQRVDRGPSAINEPAIDLLDACWASIREVCTDLTPEQWDAATDCPGWSVRDNLSHLIAIENKLLGLPDDPPLAAYPAYVKNEIGRFNENSIEIRRGRAGAAVLAEFVDVTTKRLHQLRAMTEEEFERVGWSPIGDVPYRQFMTVRLFDCWSHEQDIRRAVERPGHLTGPVVDSVLAWHARSLGYIVGKKAGAPEGAVVVFVVTGPTAVVYAVAVREGRASVIGETPAVPTATLTLDTEAFIALLGGRWTADEAEASGRVQYTGDAAIAGAVARSMGYVF